MNLICPHVSASSKAASSLFLAVYLFLNVPPAAVANALCLGHSPLHPPCGGLRVVCERLRALSCSSCRAPVLPGGWLAGLPSFPRNLHVRCHVAVFKQLEIKEMVLRQQEAGETKPLAA